MHALCRCQPCLALLQRWTASLAGPPPSVITKRSHASKRRCWDLEYNKVIRSYHGHLSGVYSVALHPGLDVLFSGGRGEWCCRRIAGPRGQGRGGANRSTKP